MTADNYWWVHDQYNPLTFESDKRQCDYESRKFTPPSYMGSLVAVVDEAQRRRDLYKMCMENRGYRLQLRPDAAYLKNTPEEK